MVRQLRYGSGLNLKEAEEKYSEVWDKFEGVKNNYSGFFGAFRKSIKPRDRECLISCIEILLLLETEDPVQKQVIWAQNIEETLHYHIRELNVQILEYLGNFRESGNERLGKRPRVYHFLLSKR